MISYIKNDFLESDGQIVDFIFSGKYFRLSFYFKVRMQFIIANVRDYPRGLESITKY